MPTHNIITTVVLFLPRRHTMQMLIPSSTVWTNIAAVSHERS